MPRGRTTTGSRLQAVERDGVAVSIRLSPRLSSNSCIILRSCSACCPAPRPPGPCISFPGSSPAAGTAGQWQPALPICPGIRPRRQSNREGHLHRSSPPPSPEEAIRGTRRPCGHRHQVPSTRPLSAEPVRRAGCFGPRRDYGRNAAATFATLNVPPGRFLKNSEALATVHSTISRSAK